VEARIPNKALIYFALKEGVADPSDVEEKESDSGSSFKSLDSRTYYQAIEKLNEVYDFNIVRDTYEEKSDSDTQTDEQTDTETTSDRESDVAESEESGDNDDAESTAIDDDSSERDAAADDVAYDVENGISVDDISGEMGDNEPAKEQTDNTNENDEASTDQAETDGTTRFQTYEEPDLDEDEYDVDVEALSQFISHHASVGEPDQKQMKTPCSTFIDVFDEWAKINNLELDKLSLDRANNMRKGSFKSMLADHHNIEKAEVRFGDKKTYAFRPIELSDRIQNIIS
jgi:hypothetical protein